MSAVKSIGSSLVSGVNSVLDAVTPGVASLLGSGISAGASYLGSQSTNAQAQQNVQSQEQFQQQSIDSLEAFNAGQADTSYQRGVADMEAAGLNPMLAYLQGGDPSATGASASGGVAPVLNSLDNASKAGLSAYSALQAASQVAPTIENTKSQTNLNNALVTKAAADTTSALSAAQANQANARLADVNSVLSGAQTTKLKSGSWMSDLVGTDAAQKGSQYLNSAIDSTSAKVQSLIDNVTNSSAYRAVQSLPSGISNLIHSFSQ